MFTHNPTLNRIKLLHPKVRDEVTNTIVALWKKGVRVIITSTLRTIAEQNKLYAQGRTNKALPIVTKVQGGYSWHNYALAFDFGILSPDGKTVYDMKADHNKNVTADWIEVVIAFKLLGWIWGADWDNDGKTKAQGDTDERFVDYPHMQKTFNLTIEKALALSKTMTNGYITF